MDVASLADLLHETAERHGSFEAVAPRHDWWDWYAAYMDPRESGSTADEASTAAGRYTWLRPSKLLSRPLDHRHRVARLEAPPTRAGPPPEPVRPLEADPNLRSPP
jgi:hypothetical protein